MRGPEMYLLCLGGLAMAHNIPRQASSTASLCTLRLPTQRDPDCFHMLACRHRRLSVGHHLYAGATPPVSGAPALPTPAIVPSNYPALDQVPPINRFAPTQPGGCGDPSNAAAVANASASGTCWWTCGGCSRDTDITTCPDQNTVHGRPPLSVHTWSHPSLTTLSTEQIIAELGWTKKAIKEITGVTPNTMRPPYGDLDDPRRRDFDTNDWHVPGGLSAEVVLSSFETILSKASTLNTGFIVLSHDLYQQTVDIATGYIIPDALARGFQLKNIVTCLRKPLSEAYMRQAVTRPVLLAPVPWMLAAQELYRPRLQRPLFMGPLPLLPR
ncbi:Polysaccharide deacetylase [Rhizoctonia solani]|uniref:chitin deacetylase n=1 Tax=Rhizoctonia solani TaxID=456999 RepID=A0A8H7M4S9_9AGAM|nr:Polysaccharide deacetylase [Rhizoctonia solani]